MNNETIELFIRKAKIFMKSAQELIKINDFESAVSRAYYAMFNSLKALLLTKNISPKSHTGTISLFGRYFLKSGIFPKEMSTQIRNMFTKRQIGDYEVDIEISKKEAEISIDIAKEFIEKISHYLKTKNNNLNPEP